MGRKPKIRPNYQSDASYLTNLSRAIEEDPRPSLVWKQSALAKLQEVITLFLQDAANRLTEIKAERGEG